MRAGVVVYSLSGNTLRVAGMVAQAMAASLGRIEAPDVRPGRLAMLRLGFAALFGGRAGVGLDGAGLAGCDLGILAAPVWAGRVAVPMRSWLQARPVLPPRLALVMTGGAATNDAAFADFERRAGRRAVARLYLAEASLRDGSAAAAVAAFCAGLERAATAPSTDRSRPPG
jgi:hypothetical protein